MTVPFESKGTVIVVVAFLFSLYDYDKVMSCHVMRPQIPTPFTFFASYLLIQHWGRAGLRNCEGPILHYFPTKGGKATITSKPFLFDED